MMPVNAARSGTRCTEPCAKYWTSSTPTATATGRAVVPRRSRQQTKDRIAELFFRGETQGNAPGSKWAAVNAIIEYGDWIRPIREGTERFGRALDDSTEKTRALQLVAAA
jgi:hypothetical protein